MSRRDVYLSGQEKFFDENEIIVSKTDLKGKITYGNHVFFRLAGFSEKELIGAPHNTIRHPDMPRCVFKLLWDHIQNGKEIFAYVMNRSKDGGHYWVLAHVTPSRDGSGNIVGYHSNRRVPNRRVVTDVITPLYAKLLGIEEGHSSPKDGLQASMDAVANLLKEKRLAYDQFIFSMDP